jgi:hypothetical protein
VGVVLLLGGLVLLGVAPFDLKNNAASLETLAVVILVDLLLATLSVVKGKRVLGLIGIFIPFVSLAGAVRLASPTSIWARRFYDPRGRRFARSQARWRRIKARRQRFSDMIAGAPETPSAIEAPLATEQHHAVEESDRS